MASMQPNAPQSNQNTYFPMNGSMSQQQIPQQQQLHSQQQVQQPQQRFQPPLQNPSLNKYLPPNVQNVQHEQPNTALAGQNAPLNPAYLQKSPLHYQKNALMNGGSTHSSRTASPSLNYSENIASSSASSSPNPGKLPSSSYMAPPPLANVSMSSPMQPQLNRSIGSNLGSGPNLAGAGLTPRANPNLNHLSNSMQNLTIQQGIASGPPTPLSSAAAPTGMNTNQTLPRTLGYSHPPTSALGSQGTAAAQRFAPGSMAYTSPVTSTATTPASVPQLQPNNMNRLNSAAPIQQQISPQNFSNTSPPVNQFSPNANMYGINNNPAPPPLSASQHPLPPSMQKPTPNFAPPPTSQQYQQPPTTQHFQQPPTSQQIQPPPTSQQFQQPPTLQQTQQPSNLRKPMYPPSNARPPVSQQQTPVYGTQPQPQQQQQSFSSPSQYQSQPQSPATFNGYPNSGQLQYQGVYNQMSVAQQGFSKLWGQDSVDLMQQRHILPTERVQPPPIQLNNQFYEAVNCSPEIMRCTVNKVPESNNLLQKSRLPLGILIHPFRDMSNLVVINCPTIVRCRLCRTYINPFVHFVDSKMWKCNLCYRINELPEDFQYDPVSKTYGEVTRRPEVRSSTIEFIAPSEYMLRPPQPAIYLFLFDVSIIAQQTGYLEVVCDILSKRLESMPGDARTKVGFIAFNSEVHFYNIAEGYSQPHEITLVDIDDIFLPCPDNLLVNVKACKDLIKDILSQLPTRFASSHDSGSALGAALQVAFKLMSSPGGRITVFQSCLPNKGPGALQSREDPNNRSAKDILHLNPATDFYKRLALDCSGQQIAVDLFLLNQQYSDLATLSGISKYSGGCIHHFPLYQKTKPQLVETLKRSFDRYLTRKIGFEAVMRVRCTRGLQIHTFHGNFFVRSTDLLSLPNVNPDAGYGMQISYEESLTDIKSVCFQAALLYTTSSGERRIRVHTMCLPVTASLTEVMYSADVQCIVGLLAKMAVDRSLSSSVSDARDAFINATVDIFNAFRLAQNLPSGNSGQLIAPKNLALLPLYIAAILKHIAFRTGTSTRLDDRVYAMDAMKTLPLDQLMKYIYPEFYHLDALFYNNANENDDSDQQDPPVLQLSAEFIDSRSLFLLDCGTLIIIYVGLNVPPDILQNVLGVQSTAEISDYCYGLPSLNTPENESLQAFIESLNENKPYDPIIQIIRDTSTCKSQFFEKLVDDRSESSLSYYEFLQHLRTQVK